MPPTIYATHADIEAELKALLPNGFPAAPAGGDATPSPEGVDAEIARVTTSLRVRVIRALGSEPAAGDDAATLIRRGVVAKVVGWVLRRVATGYSAADIATLTKPYETDYKEVLEEIKLLPDLFRAQTPVERHVGRTAAAHRRDPVLADDAVGRTDTY